jgi:hypothetical protein
MALSKELIESVKLVIEEAKLNEQFKKIFINYLEQESTFQADEENRLQTINLLRSQIKKD